MQRLRKASQFVQRTQERQLGFSQRDRLKNNCLCPACWSSRQPPVTPTRSAFGVFQVGNEWDWETMLLGILKNLQMGCYNLMRQASIVFEDAPLTPN
jgi:hypothetical protein